MVWPTRALTNKGFKEYRSPIQNLEEGELRKAGLGAVVSEDWRGMGSDAGISLWNIKGNPVWEIAAKAVNVDWNALTNSFPDRAAYNVRKDAAVEWWFQQPGNYRPAYTKTVRGQSRYSGDSSGSGTTTVHVPAYTAPNEQAWGLDSREGPVSTTFIKGMNEMNDWIKAVVKKVDNVYPDGDIIREGPSARQYGLPQGQDPWKFYGLDRLPRILPKALDVDYAFNLMDAKPSDATYRTPKGYPGIDLDSVKTAELGETFTDYLSDFDFAQEFGYWDFDLGNTGSPEYQQELSFIFGDAAAEIRIFGQMDYDNLIEQGQNDEGIRKTIEARLARGQKLIMGPAMAKKFDMYSYDPTWWGQPAGTIGQKGVKLLRLQGLDDAGIMNRYAKGKHSDQIGQWVQEQFGVRIDAAGMFDYYFQDPGDKNAFGMKDYNQLLNQGMDPTRIHQLATEFIASGGIIGGEAATTLGIEGFQAATQVLSAHGHLGGRVIEEYRAAGWDDAKLQALGMSPATIKIGPAAATELWGWIDRGQSGMFGMKDIIENWPEGEGIKIPNRIILGKIAAGMAEAIGSSAVDYIWGDEVYDRYMTPPAGAKPDAFTFGMDTLKYLQNHPTNPVKSIEGLRAIAKGAFYIGEAAAEWLGVPANKPEQVGPVTLKDILTTPIAEYDKPTLGSGEYGGFGKQEIAWMEGSGWTLDQMRSITKDFDKIGPDAVERLWGKKVLQTMTAPANAIDPNAKTFGMMTITYLDSVDPQISNESIAAVARGNANYVGVSAREWFKDAGIDIGMGEAPKHAPVQPAPDVPTTWPSAPTPTFEEPIPATPPPSMPEVEERPRFIDQGVQGGFGNEDMNWLSSHGYSKDEQIAIAKNMDKIGGEAARKLWGFTDPGDKGFFGQKDYDQIKNKVSHDTMRKIIRGMNLKTGGNFKWLG